MTTSVKVPSSIVPIDVSGEPFSRMASFRRSLIHVDFFIRRKKKDKRRNTVAEGDTKDLKNALQNIINEERHNQGIPNGTLPTSSTPNGLEKTQSKSFTIKKVALRETNNNFTKGIPSAENKVSTDNTNSNQFKVHTLQNGNLNDCVNGNFKGVSGNCNQKFDFGNDILKVNSVNGSPKADLNNCLRVDSVNGHNLETGKISLNKKRLKSHIPISTISAAMNVAVGMRERSNSDDQLSSGNLSCSSDHNSSDSDNKKTAGKDSDPRTVNGEDSGFSDSYKAHKNRVKGKDCKISIPKILPDDFGECSSESSENNTVQDDETSNATSVESDALFISSDESEEELSDTFVQKYGSSTSLSTLSDGSLNSLLSQTGTEMTSSTGTLTSLGFERSPTPPPPTYPAQSSPLPPPPPPPPPPFVIVAIQNKVVTDTTPPLAMYDNSLNRRSPKRDAVSKYSGKSVSSQKQVKAIKANKHEQRKDSADNSKGLFTNLYSKKSRENKDPKTSKELGKQKQIARVEPYFDMYGNKSPKKVVRLPTFIRESNRHKLSETEPKTHLQSFLPGDPKYESRKEIESRNDLTDDHKHKETIVNYEKTPSSITYSTPEITYPTKSVEIPLKYVQQVVVTPISRQSEDENVVKYPCRKSLFSDNNGTKQRSEIDASIKQHFGQPKGSNLDNQAYGSNTSRPQRPNTLQTGMKTAARVVLDPDGRVIYSTNSLDRRQTRHPNQYPTPTCSVHDQNTYSVPPSPRHIEQSNYSIYPPSQKCHFQNEQRTHSANQYYYQQASSKNAPSSLANTPVSYHKDGSIFLETLPSYPHISQKRFPSDATKNVTYVDQVGPKFPPPPESVIHIKKPPPSYEQAISRNEPHILIVDPNISGLPSTEDIMLTEHNINLHLENMKRLTNLQMDDQTDSTLTPLQMKEKSPIDNNLCKLQGNTMSTEDLFAVIHDCKKRMNIKTESDVSLASSSRSNSPSCLRPTPPKGTFVETGFLSPRNFPSNIDNLRNRRSWADFRPASSSPNERKSLASDRLGRTKPTSMHDFKMLLLQARSNTQVTGPRKSAVEMLKIPTPQYTTSGMVLSPDGAPPQYLQSFSVQNSPTSPSYIHNGHSTVPFKRHNSRVRSSLQSRYTMYPPIFEDCSEETENYR